MSADYFSGCMQCRNINILCGQINTGMMLGNILALASGIMFGGQFYLGAMEDNDPVSANLFSQIICILITGTYAVFCT